MIRIEDPLRDVQQYPPHGCCRICGGELYEYDPWTLCLDCMQKNKEEET